VKQTIPSPNMLLFRGSDRNTLYEENIEKYLTDLTQTYQKAIQAFYEARVVTCNWTIRLGRCFSTKPTVKILK